MSTSMLIRKIFFLSFFGTIELVFVSGLGAVVSSLVREQAMDINQKMKDSYSEVDAYRTETEVEEFRDGRLSGTQRFIYTFKKPNHIRMDMETPHSGWKLIYPDKNGKVLVKPGGWVSILEFRLSLDSTFLKNSAGQKIDQTDLGLLIHNIGRSITDQRRGELKITDQNNLIIISVLADDHFLSGVETLYRFSIDKTLWLPVKVEEYSPDGIIKRKVIFHNLKTLITLPNAFFKTE